MNSCKPLTIAAHTLGCKVNQCDTDALLTELTRFGFALTDFTQAADVYIINTCTVTHVSDKKSRQMVRRARRHNPSAFVAVCGCMARSEKPKIPEADYVFDARSPEDFISKLKEIAGRNREPEDRETRSNLFSNPHFSGRARKVLKIQDGCDRFCAYCIVPYVRGGISSRPPDSLLAKAKILIETGALEIVLTGIQVASYGEDTGGMNFTGLINKFTAIDGLKRLRLSSLCPTVVNGDFLRAVESEVICGHFHLSLQSGCDRTLERMNRRYTKPEYAEAAGKLRKIRPEAAITTDIIVGFPGESEIDFKESLDFVREMKFARVHVFEFSPRTGTAAAEFPEQVPPAEKQARSKEMRRLAAELQTNFLQKQVGTELEILFETEGKGHSGNYCEVKAAGGKINTIRKVKITSRNGEVLIGGIT